MTSIKFIRIVTVLLPLHAWAGSDLNRLFAEDPRHATSLQQVVDQRSEAFLQRMVTEEHFSGVALVTKNRQVVHAKGYANATASEKNSIDTVFHVASITKQFTAAAVLQLVEAGIYRDKGRQGGTIGKKSASKVPRVNNKIASHSRNTENHLSWKKWTASWEAKWGISDNRSTK